MILMVGKVHKSFKRESFQPSKDLALAWLGWFGWLGSLGWFGWLGWLGWFGWLGWLGWWWMARIQNTGQAG